MPRLLQLFNIPHYMTLSLNSDDVWVVFFFYLLWMSTAFGAGGGGGRSRGTEVHFKIGPWKNVLIQRCLWLREMSCPVQLQGAYITGCRSRNQQMKKEKKKNCFSDDQPALIGSCDCAGYGGNRQVPWLSGSEASLGDAVINSRGRTFSMCAKHQYFPSWCILQSGWWLI